jgi:putative ABC transport system permease protein
VSHLLKISLRRVSREKGYALINIIGLALGMGSAMIIFMFLQYETTYDTQHPDYKNIYRVGTELTIFDQNQGYAVSSAAIAPKITESFDEIESYLRIFYPKFFLSDLMFYHQGQAFFDDDIFAVDSTFFDFFAVDFIEGNPQEALQKPFSIVFTRSLAIEIFGHLDVVGKVLILSNEGWFTITGLIEDSPLNSHFQYSALMSLSSFQLMPALFEYSFGKGFNWQSFERAYGSTIVWSYIKVKDNFSSDAFLEEGWPDFHQKYIHDLVSLENFDIQLIIQPIKDIHLSSDLIYELSSERDIMRLMNSHMVYVFLVIAFFLLILAAINYTNMAISHFNKRRKEMAMVKILGSTARQLFAGFFTESFIISLISLFIALVMIELLVAQVNQFLEVNLSLDFANNWANLLIVTGVFMFTALLSGLFPALYFVFTPPVKLLNTRFYAGKKTLLLKKVLVVCQFSIAVFMISCAFVAYRQFDYMQEMDLGYGVENITAIELLTNDNRQRADLLDSIIRKNEDVVATAKSGYIFTMFPIRHTMLFETNDGITVGSFNNIQTTEEYLNLMGISIYSQEGEQNTTGKVLSEGVLINRALADSLNYSWPVGKNIITHYQFLEGKLRQQRTINGVVDNFHYALFNKAIEPLVILPLNKDRARYLAVKFSTDNKEENERILMNAWNEFDKISPLKYFHLSENVDSFFADNRNLSIFFGYFAWLCVIISFLGVFGITAYNIEQRSVEIGIRKVLGANGYDFFMMFFSTYFILFIIGSLVGIAFCTEILHLWLDTFSYSVKPGMGPYIWATMLMVITIILAIVIHIIRISFINPANSIRKE